jgi:Tfp pilus assembly protein PilO
MTTRDRLVVCALVAVAALAVIWLGVVSPKRHDASKLGASVTAAQSELASAQGQLAQGVAAEGSYGQNLEVVKQLYKAVPVGSGVPKLLVALDKTSNYKRVDFQVINVSGGATTTPVASTTPATAASVLTPIAFTFTFDGGYIALQHFIHSINSYTLVEGNDVIAHGRLLNIESVSLTPQQGNAQASITANAYSQPAATLGATTPTTASTTPTS